MLYSSPNGHFWMYNGGLIFVLYLNYMFCFFIFIATTAKPTVNESELLLLQKKNHVFLYHTLGYYNVHKILRVLFHLRSLFVYSFLATTATPPVIESKLLYIQILILVSMMMWYLNTTIFLYTLLGYFFKSQAFLQPLNSPFQQAFLQSLNQAF